MKLLITVAAASIAFGGNPKGVWQIAVAKSVLAWSILYGILFAVLLLYRYDEYAQNLKSYTCNWYASIFSLGFGSLACFIVGFMFWSWALTN
jgi:predicted membrane protein